MTSNIEAFMNPTSIAVVGASEDANKVGGKIVSYLRTYGYKGNIFPINPTKREVQGIAAYRDIESVPAEVDAVLIALPSGAVLEQIRRCASKGVKAAVLGSSGFGELGQEGRLLQDELVSVARAGGMRLLGPNCQGVANFGSGSMLNFSTMFQDVGPADGRIAIIGQSGAATAGAYAMLRQAGHGVRYVIATGNDADVNACELAKAAASDPHIKLILIYLETLRDWSSLAETAAIARERGSYVVALKSGSSQRGAVAAASHTGAIVGNDRAVDAFLAKNGIWRARDLLDFVRAAPLYLQDYPVAEGRLIAMSHSGASAVITSDLAEGLKIRLAEITSQTAEGLKKVIPGFATANNPLDMAGGAVRDLKLFADVVNVMGDDPQADVFLLGIPVAGPGYDIPGMADVILPYATTHRKPLVVNAPQQSVRRVFEERGAAIFASEREAIEAMHQYVRHQQLRSRSTVMPHLLPVRTDRKGLQNEFDSMTVLAEAGITTVKQRLCSTAEDAAAAYDALGASAVVVKGVAANITHKSEHGLVHLSLASREKVRLAAQKCLEILLHLGVDKPEVLVAEMVGGGHEFALGVSVDESGALVMVGEGGTLIELRKDVDVLLAPFGMADAEAACNRLRLAPLFRGYRNSRSLDLAALAKSVKAIGDFADARRGNLKSIDINPLIVLEAGAGVVAVDAVVEFH